MLKYVIVLDEDTNPRICKTICPIYDIIHDDDYYKIISLGTLCYSLKTKELLSIDYAPIPQNLYKRYQDQIVNDKYINELNQLGFYPYNEIKKFVEQYNELLIKKQINDISRKNNNQESIERFERIKEMQDVLFGIDGKEKKLINRKNR